MPTERSPKQEQIEEWSESPVTAYFLSLLRARLEHTYRLRAEVYFPGEPNRTQEGKAHLLGAEGELGDLVEALETQDLESLEVEERDEERVRHTSVRRSDLDPPG